MQRARGLTLDNEQGSALLLGLVLIMIVTVLGVAFFEMATIEAKMTVSDASELQAFYCADAQATRIYNLYDLQTANNPTGDGSTDGSVSWNRLPQTFPATDINIGSGSFTFTFTGSATGSTVNGKQIVTVTATCTLPNGRSRTVQRNGTRNFQNPGLQYTFVGGGFKLNPMPAISNSQKTGILDAIEAAVKPNGTPVMKASFTDPKSGATTTVYNVTEIFNQLRTNGNSGGSDLAKPGDGCTFGSAPTSENCKIWQDLVILGPRKICATSTSNDCPNGPKDMPSYYFMGISTTGTSDFGDVSSDAIWSKAVAASSELQTMGFDGSRGTCGPYGSLCQRLNTLIGNVDSEGNGTRIVDLNVGTDPITGASVIRSAPPIFYIDGYWRADGGTAALVYNGRGSVFATKSMIFADNLIYLNGLWNQKLNAPSSCPDQNDRTNCGAGDMLAFIAKEDIWMSDSNNGNAHEIAGLTMAGRDFNYFDYNSAGGCCHGPANPVTFNGTGVAIGQIQVRDWAPLDPPNGYGPDATCNNTSTGNGGCRPVAFFPTQPPNFTGSWCTNSACWVFVTLQGDGTLDVDSTKAAFNDGCTATSESNCATPTNNKRRVTHFHVNVNYDTRLITPPTAPGLIPIAMPGGGGLIYKGLGSTAWKDCGANPHPGDAWSPERACPVRAQRDDN